MIRNNVLVVRIFQTDEVQEAALRRLEQMALDWDAEGNDYLYE